MDHPDILVIGGGLAAAAMAEEYRRAGGTESITILSHDPDLPVHRPPLSKGYLRGAEDRTSVFVHPPAFYNDNRIDVRLGRRVAGIDLGRKQVTVADGERLSFGRLVLATGARPRRLPIPGNDLPGVYYLRSLASADDLRAGAERAERAVIVGAGFLGLEVAATLAQRGISCTVVETAPRVWPQLVPPLVSDFIRTAFEARGVRFRFGRSVRFVGGGDRADHVVLDDATVLETDLVVVGVGVLLNTELAQDAGLTVDHGVAVDSVFRTAHPDVYAIGDIARFPDPIAGPIHLEHWDNALHQGRSLGAHLAGAGTPFDHVAYFFSDLFDLSLNMVGYPGEWDDVIVRGVPGDGRFTAVYLQQGEVRAVLMVNDDHEFDRWVDLVRQRFPADAHRRILADAASELSSLPTRQPGPVRV
ncbi:MAG TPA: FAD/NAD(P)-binding oxidoreductase [Chloroflexota bacterium]|nr:FAD/NAD(P)-binding oxidoreductase [Chloroflexota bacterium]